MSSPSSSDRSERDTPQSISKSNSKSNHDSRGNSPVGNSLDKPLDTSPVTGTNSQQPPKLGPKLGGPKISPKIDAYLTKISSCEVFNLKLCYLLVGGTSSTPSSPNSLFRILIIHKQTISPNLQSTSLPTVLTKAQVDAHLQSLSKTYNDSEPLTSKNSISVGFGIVGLIRFLSSYQLTVITRRVKVGSINGEAIYTIKAVETVQLSGCVKGEICEGGEGGEERCTEDTPDDEGTKGSSGGSKSTQNSSTADSVLLSMWNRGKRAAGLGLSSLEIAELRYQGLFQFIDLTKNFFFSYTYDLTNSLQTNMLAMGEKVYPRVEEREMYAWNYYQTRVLESITNSDSGYWVLPLTFGSFLQRKVEVGGRGMNVILVARRSRHFAGTRYLKRGVSDCGRVANDVEHEQIIHSESTSTSHSVFSSYLQVRGSIPTYWTQESSVTMPKPPIVLNRVDPRYGATRMHFSDLLSRYGGPIVVLDLVKQSEKRLREVIVGNEYRHAIEYLNSLIKKEFKIRYCALDYSHISKHRSLNVGKALDEASNWAVNMTGFFCSKPKWRIGRNGKVKEFWDDDSDSDSESPSRSSQAKNEEESKEAQGIKEPKPEHPDVTYHMGVPIMPMEQRGVLRTNCIDCLDRTNVAQFSAGCAALAQQLVCMGVTSTPELDSSLTIVNVLMDMYSEIGDQIALQYGGSEAHKKVAASGGSSSVQGPSMGKHKEFLTSIRRYYSNAFTDRLKQDAMNLFLGYFVPKENETPLWELDNDYYLHNFHVQAGSSTSNMFFQKNLGVDEDDLDNSNRGREDANVKRKNVKNYGLIGRGLHKVKKRAKRSVSPKGRDEKGREGSISPPPPPMYGVEGPPLTQEAKLKLERKQRVHVRCKKQNELLSSWWKVALQKHLQSRMWMHLRQPEESLLPPQFERLYQPSSLTQFDQHFAHAWATPSRRGNNYVLRKNSPTFGLPMITGSVGTEGAGANASAGSPVATFDGLGGGNTTVVTANNDEESSTVVTSDLTVANTVVSAFTNQMKAESKADAPINYFIKKIGSKAKHMLSLPVRTFSPTAGGAKFGEGGDEGSGAEEGYEEEEEVWKHSFLGAVGGGEGNAQEYEEFVALGKDPSKLQERFNETAHQEFTESLKESMLESDDVEGIRELAESAHISKEILSGPYAGLLQDTSANSVATLVHEQLGIMTSSDTRDAPEDGRELVSKNLQRVGLDGTGVASMIDGNWDELQNCDKMNQRQLEGDHIKCMRSELTTGDSLNMYFSYFEAETVLADKELTYMLNEGEEETKSGAGKGDESVISPITNSGNLSRRSGVIDGFEQINDDLFARRANKFMVFNGVGMENWSAKPRTARRVTEDYVKVIMEQS
ncbi:hypothetical protein TrST_g1793 [Triparma strigata]|uniref:SAC domain-containing protein n=1 Tax=Triparma strigata TaxID=1606541 RepID=A0A9W7BTX8_9STRA|nr:hypothetical protein TrST_g1793 [Triparma strigata]